jgi:hypothetical protein
MCSVSDAGQLGVGSITVHYSGTLDTGLPHNGDATVMAGQSNVSVASIPNSAYPLHLTLSVSLHTGAVEGVAVRGFTGAFANVQATTYTDSQPLMVPNPLTAWSLDITNQAEGLLEAVFTESQRLVSIAPFYVANDPNSTQLAIQSSFVVTPFEVTQVTIPGSSGPVSGTLTLIFETGEMRDIMVEIAGPGSYVVDASGLHIR